MGNDRLEDAGFEHWGVTLRPLTAATDSEGTGAQAQETAVNISAAGKTLDIAVAGQPELPPDSFVQTSIIDAIEATGAGGDDAAEDLLRDEGGEA